MASQFLRRMFPVLRSASRLVPATKGVFSMRCQAMISQSLTAQLGGSRCMSSKSPPQIINIQDEEDFKKRVIDSDLPVVVDFHATWCGPCKLLGPRLETIMAGVGGKVVMAKVDIDENVEIAIRYNVQSVPTVYGVKNGKIVDSFIGLKEDDDLKSFVNKLL